MPLLGDLPALLKKARSEARISQADAAKAAGVSQQTLSGYETGRYSPPVEVFDRFMAACNVRTLAELQRLIDSLDPARAGEVAEPRFSPEDVARAFPGAGEETSRRLASLHEEIAFLMRRVAALEAKDPKA